MVSRQIPSRASHGLLLVAAGAFGAAAATASVILTHVLPTPPEGGWPASTLLVGVVGALWLYGVVLAAILAAADARPTRIQGWLAAFGLAPFAVALFFFCVGVGVGGGMPGGYVAVAAILIAAVMARRLLSAISEKLLLCFFAWLGLLVIPVLWSDPVNRLFSGFLLTLLRNSGVIV